MFVFQIAKGNHARLCQCLVKQILKKIKKKNMQVRLFEWWNLLVSSWLAASLHVQQQLTQIFLQNDENGDGACL